MPNIVIQEDDITTAGAAAAKTDVAFVPGFANTNFNYLIFTKSGEKPTNMTEGTPTTVSASNLPNSTKVNTMAEGQVYPNYACNTVEEITWVCTNYNQTEGYTWTKVYLVGSKEVQIPYVVPSPENTPTLCQTVSEFESYFGKTPYQFASDDDGAATDIFESAYALPVGQQRLYSAGDYEKSYIYAKELIKSGIPVVYYNVCTRNQASEVLSSEMSASNGNQSVTLTDTQKATIKNTLLSSHGTYYSYVDFAGSEGRFLDHFGCTAYKRAARTTNPTMTTSFDSNSVKTFFSQGQFVGDFPEGTYNITFRLSSWGPTKSGSGATRFDNILVWESASYPTGSTSVSTEKFNGTKLKHSEVSPLLFATIENTDPEHLVVGDTITIKYSGTKSTEEPPVITPAFTMEAASAFVSTKQPVNETTHAALDAYWVSTKSDSAEVNTYDLFGGCVEDTREAGTYYTIQGAIAYPSQLGFPDVTMDKFFVKGDINDSRKKDTPTVKQMYKALKSIYYPTSDAEITSEQRQASPLIDKGEYSIKYITSGAYPTYEAKSEYNACSNMIKLAYDRGDAVAIIDHANNPERQLGTAQTTNSVYAALTHTDTAGQVQDGLGVNSEDLRSFATMFTPWATYNCLNAPSAAQVQLMPASFGYLTALAQSIKTNANWLAIAGINRGLPPTIKALNTVEKLSNTIADAYQPRDAKALNAITNIKPYGLTIWGNRTLVNNVDGNLVATSFLNVRNLVSDIKKVAYTTAKTLLFEQDNEIMWNKFKISMSQTLDKMVTGYGISGYKIIRGDTKYNGDALGKGEVAAIIKIVPMYAVEDFEITVVMADDVSVD